MITLGDAALVGEAEHTLRPGAGQLDEALQRQFPIVHMRQHDRHHGLHARHAARARRIGPRLFLNRVRRVV